MITWFYINNLCYNRICEHESVNFKEYSVLTFDNKYIRLVKCL